MRFCELATLVATAAFSTHAGAQSPSEAATAFAHRIAGCYALVPGAWRADSVRAGDISTLHTPSRLELTEELLRGWDGLQSDSRPLFRVNEIRAAGQVSTFTYWQQVRVASDTVNISYPLPLGGIALRVTPDGQDLIGLVTAFTDAIEQNKPSSVSRPVRAERIACIPFRR